VAKRKPKTKYNPRKVAIIEDHERVLIICEGKTEQLYFSGLKDELKISTANIEILDPRQNTPDSLLKEAKKLYRESKESKKDTTFDKVYCVFDKDRHPKYQETKHNIRQIQRPKNTYFAIYSEPCFEYWLLLHYENTTRPFTCFDQLRHDKLFKKNFSNYEKNEQNIFAILKEQLPTACQNAKDNPYTNVNELVEYLQKIK